MKIDSQNYRDTIKCPNCTFEIWLEHVEILRYEDGAIGARCDGCGQEIEFTAIQEDE